MGASYTSGRHEKREDKGGVRLIKNFVDPAKIPVIVDEHRMEKRIRGLQSWIDQFTFPRIFGLWFIVIFSFGLFYLYAQTPESYLWYTVGEQKVQKLSDAVYFSFITATTTGFGDIIPFGFFKFLAVIEVVCGWLLLAAVTTRLISFKQDIIIGELYEISLRNEMAGLRTALRHFRQKMDEFISRMEEGHLKKRSFNDLYRNLASFEENLLRIRTLIPEDDVHGFKKRPEEEDIEILLNSILNSFEKIDELAKTKPASGFSFNCGTVLKHTNNSIRICESIFDRADKSRLIRQDIMEGFSLRKEKIMSSLNAEIEKCEKNEVKKMEEDR